MTVYSFTLYEYDPDKPWIVVSSSRDTIELDDRQDFDTWARHRWADDRYRVLVDREPFRWATTDSA